jgi:hypothetical protein
VIQLEGGDSFSDREINERNMRYIEFAKYMNADADEIGM